MKKRFVLFLAILGYVSLSFVAVKKISNNQTTKNEVVIYGADTCHYCTDTKAFLKEHKVAFTYFDVDKNLTKEKEMILKLQQANISLNTVSLPVVVIDREIIMNDDVANFKGFLNQLISKTKEK